MAILALQLIFFNVLFYSWRFGNAEIEIEIGSKTLITAKRKHERKKIVFVNINKLTA